MARCGPEDAHGLPGWEPGVRQCPQPVTAYQGYWSPSVPGQREHGTDTVPTWGPRPTRPQAIVIAGGRREVGRGGSDPVFIIRGGTCAITDGQVACGQGGEGAESSAAPGSWEGGWEARRILAGSTSGSAGGRGNPRSFIPVSEARRGSGHPGERKAAAGQGASSLPPSFLARPTPGQAAEGWGAITLWSGFCPQP